MRIGLLKMVFEHNRFCLAISEELIVLLKFSSPNGAFIFDDVEVDLLDLYVMFLNNGVRYEGTVEIV